MAVNATRPLVVPKHYDPMFKVDVLLHEPTIASMSTGAGEIKVEVAALCSQLEVLCRKELLNQPSHRIDNGKVSNSFRSKANLIIDRMRHVLVKDRTIHSSVEEYLGITNMSKMFPRAVQYIKDSKSFSLVSKQTHLDEYIGAMSHLHQIATLSHQINEDIIKSQRPKYLAHQLALLYQSISSLKNIEPLSQHKKSIEENFKAIKSVLINEDQPNDPVPDELRKWVWELTNQITRIVESLPSTLTQHALLPSCLLIQT